MWDEPSRVRLEEHYLRTTDFDLLHREPQRPSRDVVVAMALDRNATLTGPDELDFDTATGRPLAIYRLEARKRVERKTHSVEGLVRATAFTSLTSKRLTEIAAATSLRAADRAAATEAGARLKEAEDDAKAIAQAQGRHRRDREGPRAAARAHEGRSPGEHAGRAARRRTRSRCACSPPRTASRPLRKKVEG